MIALNCFIIIIKSPEPNKIKDDKSSSAQLKIQTTKTIFVALEKNIIETMSVDNYSIPSSNCRQFHLHQSVKTNIKGYFRFDEFRESKKREERGGKRNI